MFHYNRRTQKAELPPARDDSSGSGADNANGGWQLVRRRVVHVSKPVYEFSLPISVPNRHHPRTARLVVRCA